jgi:protein-L-isoaspartate(D-aspartate) O-methyltransferase
LAVVRKSINFATLEKDSAAMQTETAREQMIHQQLRAWHVLDQAVLETFARVPRERFVPPAYAEVAFADTEIPLGGDDHMLAPKVVGRIVQAVAPQPTDRVLEIGTGSGYLSACLAAHACSVRSLEIRADLAAQATQNLRAAGVRNAAVEHRDAYASEALGNGTYEVIVLTGSLPARDSRFEERLAPGGRLFVVLGSGPVMEASLVTRSADGSLTCAGLFETVLRPLVGAPQPSSFRF